MADREEYILCAAIHFNDGKKYEHQPKNIEIGFVVCGRRHHNCFMSVAIFRESKNMQVALNEVKGEAVQGFITNKDRFMNREESAIIAWQSGQIEQKKKSLYSEDLY